MKTDKQHYIRIHPQFQLNGQSFTTEALRSLAQQYIEGRDAFEGTVGAFLIDWLSDRDYVNVQTSGSTGEPQIISIKKKHMVNSARATAERFKLLEASTALLCLPVDFIAGKMMLVRALVVGWHIDMTKPKANPLDNVYRSYDFCAMTPFQLDNSLAKIHLLSKLIVGGGAISSRLHKKIADLPVKIYETYGMTETVTHIAARRVNSKKQKESPIPFKALSKVSLSQDDRGCLVIHAPALSDTLVMTNDLVNLVNTKKFIWLGRIDNVINSGGVKLYPEQIEKKLEPFIQAPFFIAGVPDDALGMSVTLFIEQESSFTIESIANYKGVLDAYEVPKSVYTLAHFERTANGKIQREKTVEKALNL